MTKDNDKPTVAPGINYQNKWENASDEDKSKGNTTRATQLMYDEFDPLPRRNYHDKD